MTTHRNNAFPNLPVYSAYLVRLWRDTPSTPWRASAQSVQSGETVRFGSLQALFAFLDAQTASGLYTNASSTTDDAATNT